MDYYKTSSKKLSCPQQGIKSSVVFLQHTTSIFIFKLVAMRANLIPSNSLITLAEANDDHSLK